VTVKFCDAVPPRGAGLVKTIAIVVFGVPVSVVGIVNDIVGGLPEANVDGTVVPFKDTVEFE